MFNLDQILTSLQTDKNTQRTAMTGALGVAAGLLLSGGKPGKLLGNTAKLGAMAAVGGLAYKAWQNYQQQSSTAPAPKEEHFIPQPDTPAHEELGKSLFRAMIAAAKADGQIDATEKDAIFEKLKTMPLSSEEKAWVFDELSSPLDIEAVAARANTPEQASEIYAASLVAITADTAAERTYLDTLASRLKLDPALVTEIHRAAGEKAPQATS